MTRSPSGGSSAGAACRSAPTTSCWRLSKRPFGVHVPAVACCADHQSPAQAFCDAYFARHPVALWVGSRGFAGKTTLLGLLALTEAITLGVDVTILGGSGQQSERVLEVMTRMWNAPHAPRHLLETAPALRRTRFVWGNTVIALPASQTAVRGPHPERLRVDEADEIDLPVLEAAQGQPMDRGGVRAHTVMSSTHQYADGTMTALLRRAAGQGWPTYTWCWRETLEPAGWLSQAAVDRKRSEVSVQMWNTEYELQEPVVTGRAIDSDAVEWTFDPTRGTVLAADLERGWQGEAPVTRNGVYYASGADWAQTVDYTVIATAALRHAPASPGGGVPDPQAAVARDDREVQRSHCDVPGSGGPRPHRRRERRRGLRPGSGR